MIDLQGDDGRDAAAAEYVLGTLDDTDRDAFERALADDSALAADRGGRLLAAVYAWQDRLLGLAAGVTPLVPARRVWDVIERTLASGVASAAAPPTPRSVPRSGAPSRPSGGARARARWFDRVRLWQGVGAFAMTAATLMAMVLVVERQSPGTGTGTGDHYLALLQNPSTQSTGWVVEIEAGRQLQLIPITSGEAVPAGKALQFWTKPQGAAAPTSLGLVTVGRSIRLPVARLPGVGSNQLFEITLEPSAGSPIGKPTGPILYVGRTIHL